MNEMSTAYLYYESSISIEGTFMVGIKNYTLVSARHIYCTKWALNFEQCKVDLWYEIITRQWKGLGIFVVGNVQYAVSSLLMLKNEH